MQKNIPASYVVVVALIVILIISFFSIVKSSQTSSQTTPTPTATDSQLPPVSGAVQLPQTINQPATPAPDAPAPKNQPPAGGANQGPLIKITGEVKKTGSQFTMQLGSEIFTLFSFNIDLNPFVGRIDQVQGRLSNGTDLNVTSINIVRQDGGL